MKLNKTITNFFKEILDVDVSTVEWSYGDIDQEEGSKTLGTFDILTNEITMMRGLSGLSLESALVHEVNHYVQHRLGKSLTIDHTKEEGYFKFDDEFETITISDIISEERYNEKYENRRHEIDSRIVEAIFESKYGNKESCEFFVRHIVFSCGSTSKLRQAIDTMPQSLMKDILENEWNRRKIESVSLEIAIDELIAELD